MNRGRRAGAALALGATALLTACGADGGRETVDGGVVIVTTTTTTGPTTTASSTTASSTTAPAATTVETTATTTPDDTATTTTSTSSTTPSTTTSTTVAPTVGDPRVALAPVGEFDTPVGIAVRPGDAALYVIEQPGRVVRLDEATGDRRVVLDIAERVDFEGERGLLGLAFSPDAARAYVDYTDNQGDTNIVELAVAPDGTIDPASARLLVLIDQPYGNHNGGDVLIGPDEMLYVAMGDGGSGGDPERRASDPTTRLGALLRIDPTPSGDAPYTVPADNPFSDGEHEGVAGAPEVWAWGLRNPWRIDIDPVTGDLWIADVGQNRYEEIDVVSPTADRPAGWGANFGWSAFEGSERFNDDVPDPGNLVFPVLTYEHGPGCSISGGAVYRGSAIPELEPAYVYSDYCAGVVWALDLAGQRNITLVEGLDAVVAVRRGPTGELYVVQGSGTVSRIVPA